MSKLVKIRNVATGRSDEYVAEVVGLDGTRTELQVATAAEVITGTDENKIVTAKTAVGLTTDLNQAAPGVLEKSKGVVLGSLGQLDWASVTPVFAAEVGRDASFIKMGTWATPMTITQTNDHWVAIQVNIKKSGNIQFDTAAARLRVDTGGAQALSAVGCLQLRQNLGHNIGSSAILNASVNVSAAVTVGLGSLLGGYFSIEGSGAITKAGANDCTPLVAVNNNTGGGIDNVFVAMQNGTGTTVTEIVKIVSVHGTATVGLQITATPTDSVMTTGIKITGGGQVMEGIRVGDFASSYATGSALRFGASNTGIARFYGESVADLTSAVNARTVVARHLVVTSSATVAHETYGLIGQLCVKNTTLSHLHAGVMGTFEVNTAATVSIGDLVGCSALMARIGGATITVGATGVLAGVLATQNATTVAITSGGVHAAFACRKVGSGVTWAEALHIEDALVAIRFKAAADTYDHGIKVVAAEPAGNTSHAIKVMIGTTPGYIPVYAAETF